MCSMWEKREERRPERMKLITNIGQLQSPSCLWNREVVCGFRLATRKMTTEQFYWKDANNLEKCPVKWCGSDKHGSRTSSVQGTAHLPATPLTQGITSLKFPCPASELSPPVHGPVSLIWSGEHSWATLPCAPYHTCSLYQSKKKNRTNKLETTKENHTPHPWKMDRSFWPTSAGVCAAKETHTARGEASSRPWAWSGGTGWAKCAAGNSIALW